VNFHLFTALGTTLSLSLEFNRGYLSSYAQKTLQPALPHYFNIRLLNTDMIYSLMVTGCLELWHPLCLSAFSRIYPKILKNIRIY